MDLDPAIEWAGAHTHAVLITLRRDGRAQSSDVSFATVDGTFKISVTTDRAKTANMRRDDRVVLHVTDPAQWSKRSRASRIPTGPSTDARWCATAD
jgi:hypothetical protein